MIYILKTEENKKMANDKCESLDWNSSPATDELRVSFLLLL